jgi:hypothetical protein
MLMRMSHLGTFNNNDKVEMAVLKWLPIQELDITVRVFLHSCQDGAIS